MDVRKMALIFVGGFFSGCIITTTTQVVEVDRVDQKISEDANKGYLVGTPPKDSMQSTKATRQVIRTDIELPTAEELEREPSKDKDVEGNRGYLMDQGATTARFRIQESKPVFDSETELMLSEPTEKKIPLKKNEIPSEEGVVVKKQTRFEEYIIQKGDTLQSVAAKPNVYGSVKYWVKLYNANKDVIKNPNRVYPGTKIRIPRD